MIDQIDLYCDGSACCPRINVCGYGYALYFGDELLEDGSGTFAGSLGYDDSFEAELGACLFGLKTCVRYNPGLITIHTDRLEVYGGLLLKLGFKRKRLKTSFNHPFWFLIDEVLKKEDVGVKLIQVEECKNRNKRHLLVHNLAKTALQNISGPRERKLPSTAP